MDMGEVSKSLQQVGATFCWLAGNESCLTKKVSFQANSDVSARGPLEKALDMLHNLELCPTVQPRLEMPNPDYRLSDQQNGRALPE